MQTPPTGHAWLTFMVVHPPQSVVLVMVSTQPSGHVIRLAGQVQALFAHVAPAGQAWPHVPQLPASVVVSVQTELHVVGLAMGHVHCEATHVAPTGQPTPHMPQLAESVVVLVQTPLQRSGFAPPQAMHMPPMHTSAIMHG
jgi:hypothetical protein